MRNSPASRRESIGLDEGSASSDGTITSTPPRALGARRAHEVERVRRGAEREALSEPLRPAIERPQQKSFLCESKIYGAAGPLTTFIWWHVADARHCLNSRSRSTRLTRFFFAQSCHKRYLL